MPRKINEVSVQDVNSYEVNRMFNSKDEIKYAKELLIKYLEDYQIESISDRNLLKQLVYLETIQFLRLQRAINDYDETANGIPVQILDTFHRNLNKITELREKLGLNKDKEEKEDDYSALKKLQHKFKVWAQNNPLSRTICCPHCKKLILLKLRTDKYDAIKHPFFKDRFICNEHLLKMYLENRISKEDVALVLQTSTDYIDWILERVKVAGKNETVQAQEPLEESKESSV